MNGTAARPPVHMQIEEEQLLQGAACGCRCSVLIS